MEKFLQEDLIKKYIWAGRIRFISFGLLLCFLLLLKFLGGYSYLNPSLIILFFVEGIFNQPYTFVLKKVNLYRFQFYQMFTDIIAISWILYYMGGLEAPVVSIAYYAIILWAGVVSGYWAVLFAVLVSSLCFTLVVVGEYLGIIPQVNYITYHMPFVQMLSLLSGNIAFFFAFGYFSAHSSSLIKRLQRKRQEELFKYGHRFLAAGQLLQAITHDVINHLAAIRGYADILLDKIGADSSQGGGGKYTQMLTEITKLESKNIELLSKLSQLTQKKQDKPEPISLSLVINDVLELVAPLARVYNITIEKKFAEDVPFVWANKEQIQEAILGLVISAVEKTGLKGNIRVETLYLKDSSLEKILISSFGGTPREVPEEENQDLFLRMGEYKEEKNLAFAIIEEIISRHNGKIEINRNSDDSGLLVTIKLPAGV